MLLKQNTINLFLRFYQVNVEEIVIIQLKISNLFFQIIQNKQTLSISVEVLLNRGDSSSMGVETGVAL